MLPGHRRCPPLRHERAGGGEDGYRESTDGWAELLRSLRGRGVAAPVLAVGDGALGFWGALRDVFPSTREQRCWVHYAEHRIMPSRDRRALRNKGLVLRKSA